ncbi:polyisoprenoid-binding protein YceI [Kineococcus aurantiacus]|uniref:Polyisoprenoid-binding protein YceI n=1 Tax=Kineococcus aurantiacus TaxID=37633 RepID=A0A7Y9ASU7_9ACTN|nr:polyisoprenoid-binding protein YceI [Kineococcus aurantiacus]
MNAEPAARRHATAAGNGVTGEGRVLTREGWPVTGASVTLLGADGSQVARAVTGGDGGFALLGVPAGAATMLVAAAAHEPRATSVVVPADGAWRVGEVRLRRQGGSDVPPPGVWVIDIAHSTISATAHHLGLSAVHGRFTGFSGVITVPEDVTRATVEVEIDATSIDTGNGVRDDHLRSPDFLDVARYPTLTFRAAGVQRGADGWVLAGDLTLLATTRPVELQLSYAGSGPDPWGGTRAAFTATTELHRDDFKMNWNQAVGIGVAVFGTTLKVQIDVQAVLQQ